jgi:hypothetical protein
MKAEITESKTEVYVFTIDEIVEALNRLFHINLTPNDDIQTKFEKPGPLSQVSKRLLNMTFVKYRETKFDPTLIRGGPNDR